MFGPRTVISSAQALDMLETVAPRPWARRMLAWWILETSGGLEFQSGQIIEKMFAYNVLDIAEQPPVSHRAAFSEQIIHKAKHAKPLDEIEIAETKPEGTITVPVELSLWVEGFDWDRGTAKGSLRYAELRDGFEDIEKSYKESWLEVDLTGLQFDLSLIEMLAPMAKPPAMDELKMEPGQPARTKAGGPGRRRKHDWDGAFLHLIGQAELNSVASDPDAHGAQADVAKRMADWFASQEADVPANSQLQGEARRVLDSIRAASRRA